MKGIITVYIKMIFTIIIALFIITAAMGGVGFLGKTDTNAGLTTESVIFSEAEPRVTESQIIGYLEEHASAKLKEEGTTFYRLGVKYDIDPAFAVAVSQKETSLGAETCQGISRDCNNYFCVKALSGEPECSGWARYGSPAESIEAFYRLIKESYVDRHLQTTISEIGCHPSTGRTTHCYCWEGGYCESWVEGSGSVPDLTASVRSYGYG